MSDVKRPVIERLVHDIQAHLYEPATDSPHLGSPLPLPELRSLGPAPHESEAAKVYAESERPAASANAGSIHPVLRGVVWAGAVYGLPVENDLPGITLEGLALVPYLGAIMRWQKGHQGVKVAGTAAQLTKVLPGTTPEVATGANMVTQTSANGAGAVAALEAPTAETIAKTRETWLATLDSERIAAANPNATVDIAAVRSALSLLDTLMHDLQAFQPPEAAMQKLFEHVGISREALLAGRFTKPVTAIDSHGHGILTAQEHFTFRKYLPDGVQNQLIELLRTARTKLLEMKFVTVPVAKVLPRKPPK